MAAAKKNLVEGYPLVCPFCDELAYLDNTEKAKVWPHKIIHRRVCVMGHVTYSVEEIPENQSEIVDQIREFSKDMRAWKSYVRKERANNYKGKRSEFRGELQEED